MAAITKVTLYTCKSAPIVTTNALKMKWFIDERIPKDMVYVFEYDSTEIIERI
jgi:hypothetical protein